MSMEYVAQIEKRLLVKTKRSGRDEKDGTTNEANVKAVFRLTACKIDEAGEARPKQEPLVLLSICLYSFSLSAHYFLRPQLSLSSLNCFHLSNIKARDHLLHSPQGPPAREKGGDAYPNGPAWKGWAEERTDSCGT